MSVMRALAGGHDLRCDEQTGRVDDASRGRRSRADKI
jgi:hypothetical protein